MIRFLVLMTAFMSFSTHAQQPRDGSWFAKLTDIGQLAYVAGFIEGAKTGATAAVLHNCPLDKDVMACLEFRSGKVYEGFTKYLKNAAPAQIQQGVVVFYGDYRNTRLEVTYAIIHSAKSIAGVPTAELEQSVELARQAATR